MEERKELLCVFQWNCSLCFQKAAAPVLHVRNPYARLDSLAFLLSREVFLQTTIWPTYLQLYATYLVFFLSLRYIYLWVNHRINDIYSSVYGIMESLN